MFAACRVALGGIASHVVGSGVRNEFAESQRSPVVRYVLRVSRRSFSLMHSAGEAKKLAFIIELVKYLKEVLTEAQLARRGGLFAKGLELALTFGIYFSMQKSEFLPGYARKPEPFRRGMRFSTIRFYDGAGVIVKWADVAPGRAKSMEIMVPRSKTDQFA